MLSNVNKYGNWYDTEVGSNIISKKYFHEGEVNAPQFFSRVAGIFSEGLQANMKQALINADFFLGGRSLYGAGSKGKFKASMSNCYILPMPKDNIESIFDTCKEMGRIFSYGGGCGVNLSNLRPRGATVNNSARTSTGAVSFMEIFDSVGGVIGANNRRAALIIGLNSSHPDIEEFLDIKRNNDKIQSANISIVFDDDFMGAVMNNEMYDTKFVLESGEVITKTLNAREFFMKFAEAQWDWAEPGALFINRIREHNILAGYPKEEYEINISNPCVSGRTPILTTNGYQKIEDLVGKNVTIWNGYEWSEVTPKVTGTNQQMKLVKLSNGMELECTNYHKFVMKDGVTRKKAEELKAGDKLAKWEYPVIGGSKELKEAYTHGFYSGDGSVDSNNYPQICLYAGKKELTPYLSFDHLLDQQENQKRIVAVLKKDLNLNKEFVPDATFTVSSRLQWLAGLVDSDGCLNDFRGSVAISSINREFLRETQLMLSTLGCHSSVGVMREAGDREMPDGNGGKREYPCNKSYRLVISAYAVSELVKLGLITHRVPLIANPNRNAGRFIYVTEVVDLPIEPTVYCFNEPKNHTGVFNGIMTGQCAEYMGNEYNSCNLGSINLYNIIEEPFTEDAYINYSKLENLVKLGITTLDEALDYGYDMQPLDKNRKCIDDWRAIGLGVMGLADMFVALGVKYGSEESFNIVSELMEFIFNQAVKTSALLARDKGNFRKYDWELIKESPLIRNLDDSVYSLVEKYGLRNGSLLSIAPTGTIATMSGMSGGVEPLFRISYERTTHALEKTGKTFHVFAKSVEHLLRYNGIDINSISVDEIKRKFPYVLDSTDINPYARIKLQASMQKWVDNAISSTINLKEETSVEEVFKLYIYAWSVGCKGITIFRDNCKRISILGKGEHDEEVEEENLVVFDSIEPIKRDDLGLGKDEGLTGKSYKGQSACVPKLYTQVNSYKGNIFEVFTNASKGCTSNINTITRLASLALRSGIKVSEVVKALKGANCPACMREKQRGNKDVSNSCGSCIGEALETYYKDLTSIALPKKEEPKGCACEKLHTVVKSSKEEKVQMAVCPECGERTLYPDGKCVSCKNCGYSKCD
jgi:ribonucleotide reductase alpha subunit